MLGHGAQMDDWIGCLGVVIFELTGWRGHPDAIEAFNFHTHRSFTPTPTPTRTHNTASIVALFFMTYLFFTELSYSMKRVRRETGERGHARCMHAHPANPSPDFY